MAKKKVYVGDVGTAILLDVGEDVTGATVSINVQRPCGTETTWAATVYNANFVRHVTTAESLPVPGSYRLQPQVALADGSWSGKGATVEIEVYDKFQ